MIYLDNAATSWPKPELHSNLMENFLKLGCANPGRSGHSMSVETARKIYLVRDSISELIGSPDPLQIALTCNATYAINIALFSLFKTGDHVITSSMEHNSVMRPLNALNRHGIEYSVAQCSSNGDLDPSDIRKAIKKNTKAIVITHASNILGTIMPIMEISQIAHDMNLKLIVDGAQSAGAVPVDVTDMGIDIFCFSGHKSLYGPQGTGGLFIRKGLEAEMTPLIFGGTGSNSEREEQPDSMPDKFESGTPNSPGIIALGAGIEFIEKTGITTIFKKERDLTQIFINGLRNIEGVIIYGNENNIERAPVISITIKDMSPSEVSQILDEEFNIMTRPGLHCAPTAHKTIGTFPEGTVRFGIGYFNTEEDISETLKAIEIITNRER
ncbi:MAG: aminotransferase class V-fold PLP-dependent enzyme [Spirochaetota bacterium]|nr:aminotransferase class V-fold PLP-dependent enzyme [Spirochaetota bacterium]